MILAADQHVVLVVEDVGKLPVVVEGSDEESVTLVLTVRDDARAAGRLHDRPATVECATARGVVRVSGHVERDAARPEVVRLRREEAAVVQRRDAVRVDAVLPVLVTLPFTGRQARTSTLDLSRTGLRIVQPFLLAVGAQLRLDVELAPDSAPVSVLGRVCRDVGEGGKGVAIEEISPGGEDRLAAFITERQRLALRLTRKT